MRPIKLIRPAAIPALILTCLSLSAHAQSEHPMPLPDPDPSISSFAAIPANELERLKQAATAGDSQAALKLSAHFDFYEQNHEAGLYWHIKAAELGHLQAQANLAHIFFDQYQTDRQAATLHNAEKWAQAALKNGAGADINELLRNIRAAKAR